MKSTDTGTARACNGLDLIPSANFADDWNGEKLVINPPGGHYGLVLQKIELLGPR
jgi:hypothetical protein